MTDGSRITMDEVKANPLFSMSTDCLFMSVRIANAFSAENVVFVAQLIQKSEGDFTKLKNFGRQSIRELKSVLGKVGLSLNTKIVDKPPEEEFLAILASRHEEANALAKQNYYELAKFRFTGGQMVPAEQGSDAQADFRAAQLEAVRAPAATPRPDSGLQNEVRELVAERSEQDIVKGFRQASELLGTVAGLLPDPKFRKQLQKLMLKHQAPKQ
ncbi:MAG: DNA-directed RNA polymerase subunit alpha C-terminal domain-containing protein [Alphaproteobacteria bacterium]